MTNSAFPSPDASLETTAQLARWAIERAKQLGADEACAEVSVDKGLSVATHRGDIESVEHSDETVLTVTVWKGKRRGRASTSDLSERAMEAVLKSAAEIAAVSAEDPATGLPDERDLQTEFRELDLWHPWTGTVEDAAALLSRMESAAEAYDSRITNSDGAHFATSEGAFTLANTLGFCAGYRYGRYSMDLGSIAEDARGMQRGDAWTEERKFACLKSPEALGRLAAERAVARLGARPLSNRTVPVLVDASIATGLLDMLEELLWGGALYRHASCLEGREGTAVFPSHVSVLESPYTVGAMGSGVFDDEGCAGLERAVVEGGVLRGVFLTSYSARKLGRRTTGNAGGAYNLALVSDRTEAGDTLPAMLERLGTGFYATELIGQGFNPVTGDYSRGASGFWVENGRIVAPVEGMTMAGNVIDMMAGLVAVGSDVATNGGRSSGSLLLSPLMLAGSDGD